MLYKQDSLPHFLSQLLSLLFSQSVCQSLFPSVFISLAQHFVTPGLPFHKAILHLPTVYFDRCVCVCLCVLFVCQPCTLSSHTPKNDCTGSFKVKLGSVCVLLSVVRLCRRNLYHLNKKKSGRKLCDILIYQICRQVHVLKACS